MSYQNLSYVMPQADVDAVKAAIATINAKMTFLINLLEDEKKGLFKLGPKSADFVQDCAIVVQNYNSILPPNFPAAEFLKGAQLFKSLLELGMLIDSLQEKIHDTLMAVGSEAMGSALQVYAYVQAAAHINPGMKSVEEKLSERFKKQGRRKSHSESTATV